MLSVHKAKRREFQKSSQSLYRITNEASKDRGEAVWSRQRRCVKQLKLVMDSRT